MDQFIEISTENFPQFTLLYQEVFNAPPWSDGWTVLAATERLGSFAAMPTFKGLGIFRHGQAIGLVLGWGERWVNGWLFHIKEMCVHVDYQHQGVGKKLMREFERSLAQHGFTGITLQTGQQAPARIFYEALGYKPRSLLTLSMPLQAIE